MNLSINVSSIIIDGDHALVIKRAPGVKYFPNFWTISGGGMEPTDVTVEDGAVREAKEEANVDIVVEKLIANNHTENALFLVFSAKPQSESIEIKLQEEEVSDCKWVTAEETEELEFTPFTKDLIIKALKNNNA